MDELCFRYPRTTVACGVVDDVHALYPGRPAARIALRGDEAVVHLPTEVWDQRLVPELVLGLGGRLTPCDEGRQVGTGDPPVGGDAPDG